MSPPTKHLTPDILRRSSVRQSQSLDSYITKFFVNVGAADSPHPTPPAPGPQAMSHIKIGGGGAIIANPNCSTIIALMAVTPLHRVATVKRMIVSTYQAASGAGAAAMEELRQQTRDVLDGKPAQPKIFPQQVRRRMTSNPGEHGQQRDKVKGTGC